MNEVPNPFSISGYFGPAFFCDREDETKVLINNIKSHNHTAFFALRRMGKTALIQHVFHLLGTQKNRKCIYIDIYSTQNLKDLTNQLANNIYKIFPEKKGIGKSFWEFIKLFRPIISVDALTGSPELSLDMNQPKQLEKTIPQLLQFLDSQAIKTVIAIDEFQQILSYPEKNIEALLRTAMQQLKNTTFIFCGSNQAMMQEIFNSAKRPFYASCNTINLQPIQPTMYSPFIKNLFATYKYKITDEAIEEILNYTQTHTYYTQSFCNELFIHQQKNIQLATLQQIKLKILKDNEGVFFQYRNLLTPTQWQLLKAIAKEQTVEQPYNKKFINTYNLGSPAIVKRSLESLLQKEMIYKNTTANTAYYTVYDKYLLRWLQAY
jgi:uncharacterized protein